MLKDKDKEDDGNDAENSFINGRGGNRLRFNPKLEFPIFDGNGPRLWMKKCVKYFNLCKVLESQRVDLASMHITSRADSWFHSYIDVRTAVD